MVNFRKFIDFLIRSKMRIEKIIVHFDLHFFIEQCISPFNGSPERRGEVVNTDLWDYAYKRPYTRKRSFSEAVVEDFFATFFLNG